MSTRRRGNCRSAVELVLLAGCGAACTRAPEQGSNNGRGIAAFADGSWVVTGRFEDAKAFEVDADRGPWLQSRGEMDVFIARQDALGNLDWAVQAGGPGSDYGEDVAALDDGGCLVVGHFEGIASFGSDAEAVSLGSSGALDAFLARYRADGALDWVRRFGGLGEDSARAVATCSDGTIFVAGRFESTLDLGPGADGALLHSAGKRDAYVARFRADGALIWARRLGGKRQDEVEDLATLPDGSVLVAGSFESRLQFEDGVSGRASAGETDAFLACFDPEGRLLWCQSAGGPEEDEARGVAGFPDGSSVLTGRFGGEARFGASEGEAVRLLDAGRRDVFVARYGPDGSLQWARRAGGVESDYGRAACAGPDDSCTVTGYFRDVAVFGAGEPGETRLTSSGGLDLFVARWTADGALAWAFAAGEIGPERGYALAALPDGACIAAGSRALGHQNHQEADDLLLLRVDSQGIGAIALPSHAHGSP